MKSTGLIALSLILLLTGTAAEAQKFRFPIDPSQAMDGFWRAYDEGQASRQRELEIERLRLEVERRTLELEQIRRAEEARREQPRRDEGGNRPGESTVVAQPNWTFWLRGPVWVNVANKPQPAWKRIGEFGDRAACDQARDRYLSGLAATTPDVTKAGFRLIRVERALHEGAVRFITTKQYRDQADVERRAVIILQVEALCWATAQGAPAQVSSAESGTRVTPRDENRAAPGSTPAVLATIPFTAGQPIYVDALVGSSIPVRLILDTGADRTTLDSAFLRSLGVRSPLKMVTVRGAAGQVEAGVYKLDSLEVGGARVNALMIYALATNEPGAQGYLGRDFLEHFTVTIDHAARQVKLTGKAGSPSAVSMTETPKERIKRLEDEFKARHADYDEKLAKAGIWSGLQVDPETGLFKESALADAIATARNPAQRAYELAEARLRVQGWYILVPPRRGITAPLRDWPRFFFDRRRPVSRAA